MNCYLCLVETGSAHQTAHALCQQCSAGVCVEHLIELSYPPISGMGGDRGKRHSFVCRRCYQSMLSNSNSPKPQRRGAQSHKQETPSKWSFLARFKGNKHAELPEASDVVEAVELFLKSQRH